MSTPAHLVTLNANRTDTEVISATNPLPVALGAGEEHIGQIGGATVVSRPAIAVEDTPDYADGDSVGGLLTVPVARIAAGSGYLTRLALRSAISIGVDMHLHIFDANPSASTFTENEALVIAAADAAKILKTLTILSTDWVTPKGASPWYTAELIDPPNAKGVLAYSLAAGSDLLMALESEGAINFGATTDLAAVVASEQN